MVIKDNPIGNDLNAFRASYNPVCGVGRDMEPYKHVAEIQALDECERLYGSVTVDTVGDFAAA